MGEQITEAIQVDLVISIEYRKPLKYEGLFVYEQIRPYDSCMWAADFTASPELRRVLLRTEDEGREIIGEFASIIRKKKETGFMPVSFKYGEMLFLQAGEPSFVTRIDYDSRLDRHRHLYPRAGVLR